jgi:integral membrane protein
MHAAVIKLLNAFRRIAWLEGVSFLLLLGVAMPLKYWAGMPLAVRVVGSIHGFLFVAYVISTALLFFRSQWSVARSALALAASLVPFGTFAFDRSVRDEVAALGLHGDAPR